MFRLVWVRISKGNGRRLRDDGERKI